MGLSFFESVAELLRGGHRVVVATVVEAHGSTPRETGARMAIGADGRLVESIGGGALEALVIEDARELLAAGGSCIREYRLREGTEPGDTGMVCGGSVRIHLQSEAPPERLLIFGGGHIGTALARITAGLGFATMVLDDRPEYLGPDRFPARVLTYRAGPDYSGELPPIDDGTYIAVVTRCHRTDLAALRRVISGPAAYIGLIGSRRKVRVVHQRLRDEGVTPECLERLRAPIGLPIGACTAEEIAVSIAGELIQVRLGAADRRTGYPAPVLRETGESGPGSTESSLRPGWSRTESR